MSLSRLVGGGRRGGEVTRTRGARRTEAREELAQSFLHGARDGAGEQMEHEPGSGLDERYGRFWSSHSRTHAHDSHTSHSTRSQPRSDPCPHVESRSSCACHGVTLDARRLMMSWTHRFESLIGEISRRVQFTPPLRCVCTYAFIYCFPGPGCCHFTHAVNPRTQSDAVSADVGISFSTEREGILT